MDSKGNATPSSSKQTSSGFAENMLPPLTNPFGIQQPQGMQWSPPMSQNMNPFFAAQMQSNPWSQQQQLPPSGLGVASMQHNQSQQVVSGYNALGLMVPRNGLYVDATPVGCSQDDDRLAQALHDSTHKGQTYKQAIEGLHGINQHPAHLWKDYYLDHASYIDVLVSRLENPAEKSMKKPFSYYPSADAQSVRSTSKASSALINRRRDSGRKLQKKPYERSKTSHSQKAAARTTRPPTRNVIKFPARASIPTIPSRSPSPPTTVVPTYPNSTSHVFTDADRVFFFESIQWELNRDVSLGKSALCEKLAKKAPHHSTSSWAYFWSKEHVLADKILAAAQMKETGDDMDDSDNPETSTFSAGEEDCGNNNKLESDASSLSGLETDSSDFGCLEEAPGGDESAMGKTAGDAYTVADNRVMAKYIANFDENWSNLTSKERWAQFCERHPQREYSSWQKHYKRNKAVISKLVRKYLKRDSKPALESLTKEAVSKRQSAFSFHLSPDSAEQTRIDEEKMAIDALNSLREYGNSREPSTD